MIYIEIYNEIPERRRECLYYLALGNFKLGEYTEARKYNDKLIELEPGNLQAQSLKDLIKQKLEKGMVPLHSVSFFFSFYL